MEQNYEFINKLSEFYKLFADTTRLRILSLLLEKDYCVNDIAHELNLSQSLVSHQLRTLKMGNFVKFVKDKKSTIYSISDDHIRIILKYGIEHLEELNYEED